MSTEGTVRASSFWARYAWTHERREAVNPAKEKTAKWEAVDQSSQRPSFGRRRRRLPSMPWTRVAHMKEVSRQGCREAPGVTADKSSVCEGGIVLC